MNMHYKRFAVVEFLLFLLVALLQPCCALEFLRHLRGARTAFEFLRDLSTFLNCFVAYPLHQRVTALARPSHLFEQICIVVAFLNSYPLGVFNFCFKTQLLLFDWLDWLLAQSDNAIHGFKTKHLAHTQWVNSCTVFCFKTVNDVI